MNTNKRKFIIINELLWNSRLLKIMHTQKYTDVYHSLQFISKALLHNIKA